MDPIHHVSRCADGSPESDTAVGSFDAVTLAGASDITYATACREDPPGGLTVHFQLTPAT